MSKINSEAQKAVIVKAERHLKRCLTPKELTVVAGMDEFPAKVFAEDWTGHQIAELLAERTQPDDPVFMLESLAGAEDTFILALDKLITFQKGRAKKILRALAFDAVVADFSRWLLRLLDAHKLPTKTRVLKFGLFEQAGACRIYVSGCERYDRESSDWASKADWWRADHVMELDWLSALWRDLKSTKMEPWITVQAVIILTMREFFEQHGDEFQKITGLRSVNISTGFDDGDLYEVYTTVSPKT